METWRRKQKGHENPTGDQAYPDGIAQAVSVAFNELFPFHREHFYQPYFLTSLEIHLYGWLSGTLAAVSEHYQLL
ncbi:hypothetical protein RvY_02680 [Ramazzottius varieornatus]|uniref:Uncharacterized protein n=1 Tax=Ramazzottius varieornatus TaxID=947166 RepID=A0A1D1URE5_RAMVA|nr:hypothetical protein RvY_02680 [Ramazzottius varieornatus]